MPKISFACQQCGITFERFPAAVRHAQLRNSPIRFCSQACVGAARSAGTIGAKKRRGESLTCAACGGPAYRKPSRINRAKAVFCSEACRQVGFQRGLIEKPKTVPVKLRGRTISCMFCSTVIYRKKSMLERNIGKTCGDPVCVSAYGRSLWGLEPRPLDVLAIPRAKRKYRKNNFNSKQLAKWRDVKCARCGTTENLTLDHILAVCNGGQATRENAQTLCGKCNNWKAKHVDRPLARQQLLSGG